MHTRQRKFEFKANFLAIIFFSKFVLLALVIQIPVIHHDNKSDD